MQNVTAIRRRGWSRRIPSLLLLLKRQFSGVHVSTSSAETLVRRGRITNHYSIAYSVSNISARNYQNWLMCVEVIVCNISVVFLRHNVCMYYMFFILLVYLLSTLLLCYEACTICHALQKMID